MGTSGLYEVSLYLPNRIKTALNNVSNDVANSVTEIRLRAGKPLILETFKKKYFLCLMGESYIDSKQNIVVTRDEVEQVFVKLCESSVYSYKTEISNGFITIKNGHRVGVVGTIYAQNNPQMFCSLNIRIAREHVGSGQPIAKILINKDKFSLLIVGQPLTGKTTVLRDVVRILASSPTNKKIALIDERYEIAACHKGVETKNLGVHTDVLNGYSRTKGFEIATRTLSPDIIACDEIGSRDDVNAVILAKHSGIDVIATVHAKDKNDIIINPSIRELIYNQCFDYICFLEKGERPGRIKEIVGADKIDEDNGSFFGGDSLFFSGHDDI